MYQEIKQIWIKALKSGKYKQGIGFLRKDDKFCCLGVLCDLHSKVSGTKWTKAEEKYFYLGEKIILPLKVMTWAGLDEEKGNEVLLMECDEHTTLTKINDDLNSFDYIAELIEEHL